MYIIINLLLLPLRSNTRKNLGDTQLKETRRTQGQKPTRLILHLMRPWLIAGPLSLTPLTV